MITVGELSDCFTLGRKRRAAADGMSLVFTRAPLGGALGVRPREEVCCANCENKNNFHLEINKRHG